MEDAPTLIIGLASEVTQARLSAREDLAEDLRRFAVRFRSATYRAPAVVDVEIDELLRQLASLTEWPHQAPGDIAWETPMETLVIDSMRDAESVSQMLGGSTPSDLNRLVSEDDVGALLGDDWRAPLTPFQKRDIAKLLSLRHGANFSVPGAGKTRVGLAVFQATRNTEGIERLLIVAPKSAYSSWEFENTECLRNPLAMEIADGRQPTGAEAIVVNYERLSGLVPTLGRWLADRPSMLILDEAHRMKLGAEGTYGTACMALGPRARRRLILTGTPAPNGVRDLENLFGFVWPGTGRQNVTRAVAGGDLTTASRALQPLFTRTTKGELGLRPVEREIRTVSLPPLHTEIYRALIGQFSARAAGTEENFQTLGRIIVYMLMAATSPALLAVGASRYDPLEFQVPPLPIPQGSNLYELMQDLPSYEMSPKFQETCAIVKQNAELGRKTLVWSTFIRSLGTLERLLSNYNPAVVHGGTQDREGQIKRFRSDPSCMVLLSNPATLGEGISLHRECHDAVYVDRDFAAGRFIQSLDRIHRLGLPDDVETRVTVLASEGTIDEVVAARLAAKLEFMGTILDDPAVQQLADLAEQPAVSGGLGVDDVKALMEHLRGPSS
ncbi:DEAD/DEAH box helicase [Micrococcus luteus]|uniref:DEAD/DEAH box helicase n=1 Tax=Micrococcus luteus TaxID=1270 RepID=UPI003EC0AA7B